MTSFSTPQTNPSLVQLLRAAFEEGAADLRVALPGEIVEYDATTQLAAVKPLIRNWLVTQRIGIELDPEEIPIIHHVPVLFPRSAQLFVAFNMQPGDKVLLVFNDLNISNFVDGNSTNAADGVSTYEAQERTRHSIDDAVAIPGFFPSTEPLPSIDTEAITMGRIDGTNDALALASKVEERLTALENAFSGHAHTYIQPLHPGTVINTGTAATVPSSPTVASDTIKVKE